MSVTNAPPVNLLDPLFYVDPFEAYRWLRDHSPCHWDPVQKIWGVSRYADIVERALVFEGRAVARAGAS